MNQPQDQNETPPALRSTGATPHRVASVVGMYVRAFIAIVFWSVAAATCAAVGYVACRAIWWAVQQALQALGIG